METTVTRPVYIVKGFEDFQFLLASGYGTEMSNRRDAW